VLKHIYILRGGKLGGKISDAIWLMTFQFPIVKKFDMEKKNWIIASVKLDQWDWAASVIFRVRYGWSGWAGSIGVQCDFGRRPRTDRPQQANSFAKLVPGTEG